MIPPAESWAIVAALVSGLGLVMRFFARGCPRDGFFASAFFTVAAVAIFITG